VARTRGSCHSVRPEETDLLRPSAAARSSLLPYPSVLFFRWEAPRGREKPGGHHAARRRGGAPHRNGGRVQVAATPAAESSDELADTKSARWPVTAMIRRSLSLMLAIGYFVMAITAVAACTGYPPCDTFRGAKRWRSSRY